ncbi:hypothetical protein CES85_5050 [Ochrobactrum quorumnocens]|uniref:Uncharacterized protein n=1 Tax=Ochrobactrum quorumnocens TaxID=271865 RepID=A0A248UC45_9HYPH|nr:hypothetical protein CES85_5050 [[Ochrobactrum] quorumnocens]
MLGCINGYAAQRLLDRDTFIRKEHFTTIIHDTATASST